MPQLRVAFPPNTHTHTTPPAEAPSQCRQTGISASINFPAALWQNTTCPAETLAWLPPNSSPPPLASLASDHPIRLNPVQGMEGWGREGKGRLLSAREDQLEKAAQPNKGGWQGNSCSSRIAQMCFSKSAVRQGRNRLDQIPLPLCLQSPWLARVIQGG